MQQFVCDRCDEVIKNDLGTWIIYGPGKQIPLLLGPGSFPHMQLCGNCHVSFKLWKERGADVFPQLDAGTGINVKPDPAIHVKSDSTGT